MTSDGSEAVRRKRDAGETPLERHLEALVNALRLYASSILSDDEVAANKAGGAVRAAATDFVTEAHDACGGWPNVFADLFRDEQWFDEAEGPADRASGDLVAVRARYDVLISDLPALLARGQELAQGRPVEGAADALYELLHNSPTAFTTLHDAPGLEVAAGGYTLSTVPDPLTFARMEESSVEHFIEMEDGAEVIRSAADLPIFSSREAAEEAARRSARKNNLEG